MPRSLRQRVSAPAGPVREERLPLPRTIGGISQLVEETVTQSAADDVTLPIIVMSLPGCCFSLVHSSLTLPPIRVKFFH